VRHSLISYGYKCTPIIKTCQEIFAWYTYSVMKIITFAVLLTIMQTCPPVPGKAADTGTHHSHKVKKHSGNKQKPSSVPIVQKPVNAQTKDCGCTPQTTNDEQRRIIIGQPVTVTVQTSLA